MVTGICNVPTCSQIPKVFAVCVISNTLVVEIQWFGTCLYAYCCVTIDTCWAWASEEAISIFIQHSTCSGNCYIVTGSFSWLVYAGLWSLDQTEMLNTSAFTTVVFSLTREIRHVGKCRCAVHSAKQDCNFSLWVLRHLLYWGKSVNFCLSWLTYYSAMEVIYQLHKHTDFTQNLPEMIQSVRWHCCFVVIHPCCQ
jgi:hypothetical protein